MTLGIFLVDDNSTFLKAVCGFLRQVPSVQVIGQATSGSEALTQISRLHPDVVRLDIGLPDISGIDVAQTLSAWHKPPQIIFLTMCECEGYLEMAQQFGAVGFVNKSDFAAELPILLGILATLPSRGSCA